MSTPATRAHLVSEHWPAQSQSQRKQLVLGYASKRYKGVVWVLKVGILSRNYWMIEKNYNINIINVR